MAIAYGPFDAGSGSSIMEAFWSKMARNWLSDGPIEDYLNECAVTPGVGRQAIVDTGGFWVKGHFAYDTATTTLTLAANSSGNPRIDSIVLDVDWVNNTMGFEVLQGTPAASPVPPTLTQTDGTEWMVRIANIYLANGYTSIVQGDITDLRVFASGVNATYQGIITGLQKIVNRCGGLVSNPQAIYAQRAQMVMMRTAAAITITRIHIAGSDHTPTTELTGDLRFADDNETFTNATVIDVCDTTNGAFTSTTGMDDPTVPAGKYIYFLFDASPHIDWKDFYIEFYYTYD